MRGALRAVALPRRAGARVRRCRASAQADPNKVLRVAFPVAETGFDPQAAGDVYSNYVNRAIFDPLYKYDYLARPYKLVPNTAAALPEISADGKTWTIRIKPGIYFADDPAFKGQRRELTAADYVYSWKRVLDPRMRSNSLQTLRRPLRRRRRAWSRRRRRPASSTTTRRWRACRRSTATRCGSSSTFADYELLSNLTTSPTRRGRARGRSRRTATAAAGRWRIRSAPVRTGSRSGGAARRSCSRRIRAFATSAIPESSDPADRAIVAKLEGQEAAARSAASRSASSRKSNPRLLAFEQGDLDYVDGAARSRAERARPGQQAEAALRQGRASRSRAASSPRSPTRTSTWRTRSSAATRTDKIALRRAIGMAYNVDEEIRVLRAGPGRAGDAADAAERHRLRPEVRRPREVRSGGARRRCSTSSATSTATGTAGATCPTASRSC